MNLQAELWDAEDRGIKEGRKEGRKEGLLEGIEKGRLESTIEFIRRKMNKGMTFEEASDDLELTADEIDACKKRMEEETLSSKA